MYPCLGSGIHVCVRTPFYLHTLTDPPPPPPNKQTHTVAAAAGTGAASSGSEVVSMADDKFSEWLAASAENEKKWEQSLDDPKSYE